MTTTDKTVKVRFNSRIIDQLGTDMYQSPVSAIAELISNAWDADAENVSISYPTENIASPDAEIVIKDNGVGMSFEELQDKYLNIGYNRRGANMQSFTEKGRRIMGRKGLGKFSGFGIANLIEIESVSQISGERFIFKMEIITIESKLILTTWLPLISPNRFEIIRILLFKTAPEPPYACEKFYNRQLIVHIT